jgi:hypothetical protein
MASSRIETILRHVQSEHSAHDTLSARMTAAAGVSIRLGLCILAARQLLPCSWRPVCRATAASRNGDASAFTRPDSVSVGGQGRTPGPLRCEGASPTLIASSTPARVYDTRRRV